MRKTSLVRPSLLVIASMLVSVQQPALGQSINAGGEVIAGGGSIDASIPGRTNIQIDSPSAVIGWGTNDAPGSGPINFQSAGTTATYTSRLPGGFAVLNLVTQNDPTRPIQFNGTVISQLQNAASGIVTRGGTLFFYSPGGIVVGPTGVFDVGSLVLTSSNVNYDPATGVFGDFGRYSFQPANPGSSVRISPGAKITAGPLNSFVALVAPKVVNAGTITVDGSAVLVAADASTITFRPNGLFDIVVDQGTSTAGEVVTNSGTITGPTGTINAPHRIYMVAVPKNDAITMAIKSGSKLGFDIAGAADVVGNAIVLSAGYDVGSGEIFPVRSPGGGAAPTTLAIGAIDGTSRLTGWATGQASLTVEGGKSSNFAADVSIAGVRDPSAASDDGALISVSGVGSTLAIASSFFVNSFDAGAVNATGSSDSSGVRVEVNQGKLTVGGDLAVNAARSGFGAFDVQGGAASVEASNGAVIDIGNDLIIDAEGIGIGSSDSFNLGSFAGLGGTARLTFGSGAAISVTGNLTVQAQGTGGISTLSGFAGGDGSGGTAVIEGLAGGGTFSVGGTTLLDARGIGGNGDFCVSCTVEGGAGTGGIAGISAAAGANFQFGGVLTVDASSLGGAAIFDSGKSGGSALGGQAFVRSTGGAVVATGAISLLADGVGGAGAATDTGVSGSTGFGGSGGTGTGGTAILSAGDASSLGTGGAITLGSATLSATGSGGSGNTAEVGTGGQALVSARNGTISGSGVLSINASGSGGVGLNGGSGATGRGGTAQVMAYSALEGDASVTFATGVFTARGDGGASGKPSTVPGGGGTGGIGTGGQVSALAEAGNGALSFGEMTLNASGGGGSGGDGGVNASGIGAAGGAGGAGFGGTARFGVVSGLDTGSVNAGKADFADTDVLANGNGGSGGVGGTGSTVGASGRGGDATGGAASLVVEGGAVNLPGGARVLADARGGGGGGGLGTGGDAFVGGTSGADGLLTPLGVLLDVASRTGHADQQGRLTGGALVFSSGATGGLEALTVGTGSLLDHPLTFSVAGGTVNATSLDFSAAGAAVPAVAPSVIALSGGDTTLTGAFSFLTPGTLTAALGGADLFSDTALISAGNWLAGPAPAGVSGTVHGTTSVTLLSGDDLFAFLSVQTGASLALTTPGLIRLDDLTATGTVTANAGTNLQLGNVSAGQSAQLNGKGRITLGGDVVAGDAVLLVSDGAIAGKGLSAGIVSPSSAADATYDVTVFGKGTVDLGIISAATDIKLFTPQALTVGALAGRDIAVLGGGKQTITSVAATRRVLLADYEMVPFGGAPLGVFDLDAVFAAAPIAAGGPIAVLRSSSTGLLTAVSVTDITTSAISATEVIDLRAGGALSTGALSALGVITATSTGTMDLLRATSGDLLDLNAGGALAAGFLSGKNGVTIAGLNSMTSGPIRSSSGGVGISAAGNLASGRVTASAAVSLSSSGGSVTASGPITAGTDVTLTAFGDLTTAGVTAAGTLDATGAAVSMGDVQAVGVSAAAGTTLDIGRVLATSGAAKLSAVGNLKSGQVGAAGAVSLASSGGSVTASGVIKAGADATLAAAGDLTTGAVSAGGVLDTKGAAVRLGDVRAASVTAAADTTLVTGRVTAAAGAAKLSAAGNLASGAVSASGAVTLASTAGNVTVGNLVSATGPVSLSAKGAGSAGTVTSASGIAMTAGSTLGLTSAASSAGDVVLGVTGDLTAGDLDSAAGRLLVSAGGAATLGNLAAAGLAGGMGLQVSAGTTLDLGNASVGAGELRLTSGGAMSAGDLTASAGVLTINAGGVLGAGKLKGYDQLVLVAGGDTALTGDAASAAGDVSLTIAGALTGQAFTAAAGKIGIKADGKIGAGALTAANGLTVSSGDVLAAGNLRGSAVDISAANALQVGTVKATGGTATLIAAGDLGVGATSATGAIALTSSGGKVTVAGPLTGGAGVTLAASGDLTTAAMTAGGAIDAKGAAVRLGDLRAASVTVDAGSTLAAGRVTATAGAAKLSAAGDLASGRVSATDVVSLASSGGSVTADGAIIAGTDVTLAASGNLTAAALSAGGAVDAKGAALVLGAIKGARVKALAGTTLNTGTVTATGGTVMLGAASDLVAGRITSTGAASLASSGGTVTGKTINAGGDLSVSAAGDLRTLDLASGGRLVANGQNLTLGNVRAGRVSAGASGTLTVGTVDATVSDAGLLANGRLRTGAVSAAGSILMTGASALSTGDLAAGGSVLVTAAGNADFGSVRGASGTVELRSDGGSLTGGTIVAGTDTALFAAEDLTLGAVTGRDMLLLAGGGVRAAGLTSRDGRILVASNALAAVGGAIGEFNFNAVFVEGLRPAGGTVIVAGPVSGGSFTAAVAGDANLLDIDSSRSILVDSGGTVSLGGIWSSPQIEIRAKDLVMPSGSGLDAGRAGAIALVSKNGAGMRIGDGLDGSVVPATSYTLDNAEWGRIKSGSLSISAVDGPGPVTILIGDLDVTGPDAGSTIDDPAGKILFHTGEAPSASPSGTIRVSGALKARGFRAGNALVFQTGQFQLASDTGSVAVLGKGDALSGAVQIEAQDIHIAAAPLLVRLAANPFFAGVETALDKDSAGGSQPVLRAGALDLAAGRTLYIQRSGAGTDPLGFDGPLAGLKARATGAGPVTVIINGTFQSAAGVIGGKDAWKLFTTSGPDLKGFSADSRLNGCLLNAATCGVVPPVAPPPDPDPGIRTLIEVLEVPGPGVPPQDDPDKPVPPSANAILPSQTILAVQPDSLPGEVDEAIAGSGNPALTGSGFGQMAAPRP